MNFIHKLNNSFVENSESNAFCIDDRFYSYGEFLGHICRIREVICKVIKPEECFIGLVINNDIETYAAIFSLWMESKAYIPISPLAPNVRNVDILNSIGALSVLDSSEEQMSQTNLNVIHTVDKGDTCKDGISNSINYIEETIAYILFTSGSTGRPKGIPISFKNLNALITELDIDEEYKLRSSDRCLQMYDLTFDASLTALLPALLAGACLYTVPQDAIKYFHVFKLIKKYELTVLKMVPSIVHYLRPYFSEIEAPSVRFCVFGGEKLQEDLVKEWTKCIPNGEILNHYGPTEFTVCSGYYKYRRHKDNRSHNGVLSIGKPFKNVDYIIIDEANNVLDNNQEGELCLSGDQLTNGYWNNDELNHSSFFTHKTDSGIKKRFYKTGDLCFRDPQGYYMYIGRKDFQVKLGGYRVELGEIEYHARCFPPLYSKNLVVINIKNTPSVEELVLAIESDKFDVKELLGFLNARLLEYMVPKRIVFLDHFPYNKNGKLDREALRNQITLIN